MKKTASYSIYALIIALLIHIIIILVIVLISKIQIDEIIEDTPPQRFKISLKDLPEPKKEAIVENHIEIPKKAPPMPQGEQLEKQTPKKPETPKIETAKIETSKQTPEPIEPKKAFERHTAKKVADIEKKTLTKEEFNLHSALSKADSSVNEIKTRSFSQRSESVQKLYGDTFGELSEGEQKYLLDNFEVMRRITQGVLSRYGPTRIPDSIRVNDINIIEFYLHPDGSISDMKMIQNSRLAILDATTKEVMELSYAKYPRPAQKTLIRYRVWYDLRGY